MVVSRFRFLALFTALLVAAFADTDAAGTLEPAIPPIITAAGRGDAAEVARLLVGGASANTLSPDAETPLHVAAITGDPATVAILLEHGADPNARAPGGTQRGMTPMHWAAYGGHEAMVAALLAAGADRRLADDTGMDALAMAKEAGHAGVARVLEGWAAAGVSAEGAGSHEF